MYMNATHTTEATMHSTKTHIGNWMTAKEMALLSHNLDKEADFARRSDGSLWGWSEHSQIWACVDCCRGPGHGDHADDCQAVTR